MRTLSCDMKEDCQAPVTHIGEKGYVYCKVHGVERRQSGYERTRQMRRWELDVLESGTPLSSYKLQRRPICRINASLTPAT